MTPRLCPRTVCSTLGVLAALCLPASARSIEPRFDHRDQRGVLAELGFVRDSVTTGGGVTVSASRPLLRVAYGFDLSGQGDELLLGASSRLDAWGDHRPEMLRLALEARYRGYFGTEELKTFFEVGLGVPVSPKLAIGPRVGLGAIYDFGRSGGICASAAFATGLGQVRLAAFEFTVGGQIRW